MHDQSDSYFVLCGLAGAQFAPLMAVPNTIFAICSPSNPDLLGEKIKAVFGDNSIKLQGDSWLIAAEGTTQTVSEQIEITQGATGTALIVSVSGYFGRQPVNVWEWIKAKWEAPLRG